MRFFLDKYMGKIYIAHMMKIEELKQKKKDLLEELNSVDSMLEGSVGLSRWHCKNKKCKCHTKGELHQALILTWKEKQKSISRHVPKALHDDVRLWVSNMSRAREILKEISELQREIFYLKRGNARKVKE